MKGKKSKDQLQPTPDALHLFQSLPLVRDLIQAWRSVLWLCDTVSTPRRCAVIFPAVAVPPSPCRLYHVMSVSAQVSNPCSCLHCACVYLLRSSVRSQPEVCLTWLSKWKVGLPAFSFRAFATLSSHLRNHSLSHQPEVPQCRVSLLAGAVSLILRTSECWSATL